MSKKRLTPEKYRDEVIRRQIQVTRYASGQVKYVRSLIDALNEKIARYCLKNDLIETKSQYEWCRKYIKAKSIEYREKLYGYLQKELRDFVTEQSKWIYANSPVKLKKTDIDRIMKDIFFTAYSDTDDIKGYVTRIFNQVFQIWNAQLTIAYKTRQTMKDMVKLILDKEFK
jgi:hypothetical protein